MIASIFKRHLVPRASFPFARVPSPYRAMSQHGKVNNHSGGERFAAQTRARLETIRTHLETAPRTGRLKGKTCVITGAGSVKGIGSVQPSSSYTSHVPHPLYVGGPPHCSSLMRVGARSSLYSSIPVDPCFWSPIQVQRTSISWISFPTTSRN